jgi:hypothetical protein
LRACRCAREPALPRQEGSPVRGPGGPLPAARGRVDAAPDSATPLEAVAAALDALTAGFTAAQREFGPRLLTVITDNPELQERATFKRAALAAALTSALGKRGVPDLTASAAELGVRVFHRAFEHWADPASQQTLTELAHQALDELRAAAATLG